MSDFAISQISIILSVPVDADSGDRKKPLITMPGRYVNRRGRSVGEQTQRLRPSSIAYRYRTVSEAKTSKTTNATVVTTGRLSKSVQICVDLSKPPAAPSRASGDLLTRFYGEPNG
jgi:hypothetical protein